MPILINQNNSVKSLNRIYYNNSGTRKQLSKLYVNSNNAEKEIYPGADIYKIEVYKATKYKVYSDSESGHNNIGLHGCPEATVYGAYSFDENTGLFMLSNDITDKLTNDGDGYYSLPSGTKGYCAGTIRAAGDTQWKAISVFASAEYMGSWFDITCDDSICALPIEFSSTPTTTYYSKDSSFHPNSDTYQYKDRDYDGLYFQIDTYDEEDAAIIYYPGKIVTTKL